MNLKKLLFLCLLLSSPLHLFSAEDDLEQELQNKMDQLLAHATTCTPEESDQVLRLAILYEQQKPIEALLNKGIQITNEHFKSKAFPGAHFNDKIFARWLFTKIDFSTTPDTLYSVIGTLPEDEIIALFNLHNISFTQEHAITAICLTNREKIYKKFLEQNKTPLTILLQDAIDKKDPEAILFFIAYAGAPASLTAFECVLNNETDEFNKDNYKNNTLHKIFFCFSNEQKEEALFLLEKHSLNKDNSEKFKTFASNLEKEEILRKTTLRNSRISKGLISLATALICFYDYHSFVPKKNKTPKIGVQQNEPEKQEKKSSKFKAYLFDLKAHPLEHKKLLISLPVGIIGLIALNAI